MLCRGSEENSLPGIHLTFPKFETLEKFIKTDNEQIRGLISQKFETL